MANRIKLKRSTVPGRIPNPADLDIGEIAVNTADGIIYTKHSDNTIVTISGVSSGNTNIYNGRTIVNTNVTLVDSFSATGTTSVRWTLSSHDSVNNKYKTSTVDSTNNGSSVFYNEYGIVLSDSSVEVATFTANITGGNITLYALGESANVAVTYQRTSLGGSTLAGYVSGVSYTGYTGSAGTNGYTGSTGSPGATGAIGYTGSAAPVSFLPWTEVTANTTILVGSQIIVDTSSNVTITLPANPTLGAQVRIVDGYGFASNHSITVNGNGANIQGVSNSLTIDVDRAAFGLVYFNVSQGWVITEK